MTQFKPVDMVNPMNLTKDVVEYRELGDDKKVVRFNSKKPQGMNLRIKANVPVNGITFRLDKNGNPMAEKFAAGENKSLHLVPEPENPVDKNAIAIWGDYSVKGEGEYSVHVGYVPAYLAKNFGDRTIGVQLKVIFLPLDGQTIGIRYDLWEMKEEGLFKMEGPPPPPLFDDNF